MKSISDVIKDLKSPVINKRHEDGCLDLTPWMSINMSDKEVVKELLTLVTVRFPHWCDEQRLTYVDKRLVSLREEEKKVTPANIEVDEAFVNTEYAVSFGDATPVAYINRTHYALFRLRDLISLKNTPDYKQRTEEQRDQLVDDFVNRHDKKMNEMFGDGPDLASFWRGEYKLNMEIQFYLDLSRSGYRRDSLDGE